MTSALLFGSIGSLAETSDIQRRAYNQALSESDLNWQWDPDTYRRLLTMSGGKNRLRLLADATGTPLTDDAIDSIHARKTEIACEEVRATGMKLIRPGVVAAVAFARDNGLKVGLVTGTYRANIDAIADAGGTELDLANFDIIVDKESVERPKPAPDAYNYAIKQLGIQPGEAVAVEDTAVSVLSAHSAGLRVIATPGALTDDQLIVGAELVVSALGDNNSVDPQVQQLLTAG